MFLSIYLYLYSFLLCRNYYRAGQLDTKHHERFIYFCVSIFSLIFVTGQSSANILKLLTVNLEAMGAVRQAFGGHEAFNVHPTTHHTEQDPFPDQLKGMWYCLREKLFQPQSGEDTNSIANLYNRIN